MAQFDKYLIAPQEVGLQLNVKPWLIANDAYERLDNCYAFRGTIRKRFGGYLMGTGAPIGYAEMYSRLRLIVGNTNSSGNASGNVPGNVFKVGQAFSIGSMFYTVVTTGVSQNMLIAYAYIGITNVNGSLGTIATPFNISGIWSGVYAIGQIFIVGTETFTIASTTPGDQPLTASGTGNGTFDASTGNLVINSSTNPNAQVYFNANSVALYSTTDGAYSFTDCEKSSPIYFYPSTPVMGFAQYQPNSPINNKPAYAFDQQFAYIFKGGFWQQAVDTRGSAYNPLWHGIDTNFFWTCNWQGNILNPSPPPVLSYEQALFVSNFYTVNPNSDGDATDDPIWYWTDSTWNKYQPYVHPSGAATVDGPYVATALLMVAFKGRLILLNTIENDGTGDDVSTFGFNTQHQNRARWSHTGSPFAANPSDPLSINNAFFEGESYVGSTPAVAADGGDYLDAATDEAIISCEFIKDALIVQFERSTWELSFTNNELVPFIWRKLNTELGCESTFSSVPFDQFILSVGQTGVHACNGSNVERIDAKIPDEVFKIKNPSDGTKRVHGIRDYFTEMVYWTFPRSNQRTIQPYPQRILVYNYQNKSWAFNDDSITAFGYFEQQQGATWASSRIPWNQANFTWDSGQIQANFRQIIAGNQQGFVFIVAPDIGRNAPAMQITNISYIVSAGDTEVTFTVIDHNLRSSVPNLSVGDYVLIENVVGTGPNLSTVLNGTIGSISVADANTFVVLFEDTTITGTYVGGGTITRVSNINVKSRQWNPYIEHGQNVLLNRIDFCVARTNTGEVTVDYSTSAATNLSMVGDMAITNTNLGTNILETKAYPDNDIERQSTRLWHSVYFNAQGENIQLFIYMSPDQITNPAIALEDFRLEGLILNTRASNDFLQG